MPTLPTLDVTQAQADRMMAAYGSVAGYRQWLKQQIIEYVVAAEARARVETFRAEQDRLEGQARADLSG